MSLFERIREKRINLNEQTFSDKQRSDMKKLLNKNFGSKEKSKKTAVTQKQLAKDNKKMFDVTGKSAVRDAKKYATGEYPKIGGGTRMGSKSKGPGAETGAKVNLNPTSGSKSKGTTPVKVNITKPIKQSEVSKKAKKFTNKINVKKIEKDADRLVRKAEKGDKAARKQILNTVTKKFKKLSPADQQIQLTKMADIQKKMGRTLNPKTGNFEGPDTKFQKDISKIKGSTTGKRITSGPVSVTAGPEIRKRVEKIRDTRATKAGMPDPFKSTTKAQTNFDDIFKGAKKTKKFPGGKTQFDVSKTPVGKMKLPPKKVSPEVQKKTFDAFKTKISDATKQTKQVSKKIGSIKSPKPPFNQPVGYGGYPGSKTVKQSEVSKKAKEFTQNINQKKVSNTAQKMSTVKGDPLSSMGAQPVKKSKKTPTPKPKTTNVFKKVTAATSGKKVTNSKGIGNKFRGKANKAAKDAMIKSQRDAAGMGGGKPPKPPGNVTFSAADFPGDNPKKRVKKFNTGSTGKITVSPETGTRPPRVVTKQTRALQSAQGKFAKSKFGKVVKTYSPQVYKGLKTLGPGGRALVKKGGIGGVAVAGLLSSPAVRKFIGGALPGAAVGLLAGKKKEAKPKAVLSPEVKIRTKRFSLSPGEKGGFTDVKYPKKS